MKLIRVTVLLIFVANVCSLTAMAPAATLDKRALFGVFHTWSANDFSRYASSGGNLNLISEQGRTLLHSAVEGGNFYAVQFLVNKVANIDARDNNKHTPLWLAAYYGQSHVLQLLKNTGADINALSKVGQTPLMAGINHPGTVRKLLELGADPSIRDQNGHSPLEVAALMGDLASVIVLAESIAKAPLTIKSKLAQSPIEIAAISGDLPAVITQAQEIEKNLTRLLEKLERGLK